MNTYSEGNAVRSITLTSTDGGQTWHGSQVSGSGGTLSNYTEGEAVKVILLKTADGGTTWSPIENPTAGGSLDLSGITDGQVVVAASEAPVARNLRMVPDFRTFLSGMLAGSNAIDAASGASAVFVGDSFLIGFD